MTTPVVLQVWADLVCPWCFIAKRRIRAAIAAYELPKSVEIRHRAYELDPGMPPGQREPVADYLGRKYGGGRAAGVAMTARVTQVAARDGLALDFGPAVKANSRDAHRLVALAETVGGWELGQAMLERAYAAHFQQGLALDDHAVLVRIAGEAGVDEREAAAVLQGGADGDRWTEQVVSDQQQAQAMGVSAVPFVMIGGYGVSGAQPVSAYLEAIRLVGQSAAVEG